MPHSRYPPAPRSTISDVSLRFTGFVIAAISVVTAALQQIGVGALQRQNAVGPVETLAATAPVQVRGRMRRMHATKTRGEGRCGGWACLVPCSVPYSVVSSSITHGWHVPLPLCYCCYLPACLLACRECALPRSGPP